MFKKKKLTATSLGIRILVGGYLVYLAYSLIPAIKNTVDTKEMIFWIAIIAIFCIVGVVSIVLSVKAFLQGDYDKGIESEKSETIENEEIESEVVENEALENETIEAETKESETDVNVESDMAPEEDATNETR